MAPSSGWRQWEKARVIASAGCAALCVLACLGCVAGALAALVWQEWVWAGVLLAAAAALAGVSRKLDRAKMRLLYGEKLGGLLHASDEPAAAIELARRDLLVCHAQAERAGEAPLSSAGAALWAPRS